MAAEQETKNSAMGVPAAIVLAGGLIALALYFGGKSPVSQGTAQVAGANNPGASQPAIPNEPSAPVIGDLRAVSAQDHVRGAANAKVTIIEYSDTECPFCKKFHNTVQEVMAAYPNDVRWVYRHSPIEQLHSKSKDEAVATECAGEQGKFWEMLDKIYEVTPSNDGLDLATLPDLAKQVGVTDAAKFAACLKSDKYAQVIDADIADAQVAGGQGTPYSVVIGPKGDKQAINGAQPIAQIKAIIDPLLK